MSIASSKLSPQLVFFHFKNTFQRRSDWKGFKSRYEKDEHIHNFINQSSAVSHLPIALVEKGLKHVESKFQFEDEKAQTFKADFMKYIYNFWVNGPIPVKVWNVFGRSDDLTNNHQEGYNSKFNKELNVTHPSPGVLLCHVKSQITLSEDISCTEQTCRKYMEKCRMIQTWQWPSTPSLLLF